MELGDLLSRRLLLPDLVGAARKNLDLVALRDEMYVNDAQSTDQSRLQQGIRVGGVKDGKVTAFIPQTPHSWAWRCRVAWQRR